MCGLSEIERQEFHKKMNYMTVVRRTFNLDPAKPFKHVICWNCRKWNPIYRYQVINRIANRCKKCKKKIL